MLFPDSPRVIYARNPLEQVICQLRFPTILKIESELPAEFQEAIRTEYPTYSEESFGPEVPPELAKLIGPSSPFQPGHKIHSFSSDDQLWNLGLCKDSIALATRRYERWEGFWGRLKHALERFIEIYAPSSFSRVGLRYRNVIQRKALGLEEESWSSLVNPSIAGELSEEKIANRVEHVARQLQIKLEHDDHKALLRHGLAHNKDTKESVFVIDVDFFVNRKVEVSDVEETLEKFHAEAHGFFRWCIQDRLHEAMQPARVQTS